MKKSRSENTIAVNELILNMIRDEKIGDQKVIVQKLREKNFAITQSTLSRRLRKLGIVKRRGMYVIQENVMSYGSVPVFRIDIIQPNLIVVETLPGYASAVTITLDNQMTQGKLPYVAATVGGDDIALVVIKSQKGLAPTAQILRDMFTLEKKEF